jgi:hypothetical protein
MENPRTDPAPNPSAARTVENFITLRDSLVELSLALGDYRFSVNSTDSVGAAQKTQHILEQVKSRGLGLHRE